MFRRIWIPVVTALVAGMGLVGTVSNPAVADPPPPPGDVQRRAVDVYTEPGEHEVNGRKWRTTCEEYSTTVERCRAEITATQVRFVGGKYQEVTGWFFNNLTYKPSPRAQWEGNPLGNRGTYTISGRQWKTECDTAETGRNGCRSYIMSKDVVVKTLTPRTYERVDRWVFNNVVQFTVPKPVDPKPVPKVWCNNAPLPYRMALRNRDGLPYYTNAPYSPADMYNPTSIANFIQNISRDGRLSTADKSCLANLAGNHLIDGSHTEGTGENTARWFGYRFDFSANPSVPKLSGAGDGWFSGLAQGGALSAFVEMNKITGDAKWLAYGRETFRSFAVRMNKDGSGGIKNYINVNGKDVLWFEEYPTSPATSVLNGHLEAVIGLDIWAKATGDRDAKALVNEALDGLEPVLAQEQVKVQGGILTTYDLIRGYRDTGRDYEAGSIRLASTKSMARPTAALNGTPITMPLVTNPPLPPGNLIKDPGMAGQGGTWSPNWKQLTTSSNARLAGGAIVATTDGAGWQGVSQVIKGGTYPQGRLALGLQARLQTPSSGGAGASGKVAVYQQCAGSPTELVFETQKMRSSTMSDYTMSFTPRYSGCDLLLQLTTSSYGLKGTKITYDNVSLRGAENPKGGFALSPKGKGQFTYVDQFVYNQPVNTLTLSGNGTVQAQVYEDGRWQTFSTVALKPGVASKTVIPERVTGRNIHYGYHESHVGELISLYNRTKGDVGKERGFLRDYAASWVKMAPAKTGLVPAAPKPNARMMSVDDPGDTYEIDIIDPFSLLEEE